MHIFLWDGRKIENAHIFIVFCEMLYIMPMNDDDVVCFA